MVFFLCVTTYTIHTLSNSICQELFLVVPKRVELFLDPYERSVRTARRHYILVRVAGLEPTTSSFQVKHSTRLSYTLIVLDAPRGFEPRFSDSKSDVLPLDDGAKFGEGTESRTLASSFGDWRATITLYLHIGGRCEN